MRTKIIEAGQSVAGGNHGKFMLCRPDTEWRARSGLFEAARLATDEILGDGAWIPPAHDEGPLLAQLGWGREHLWVLDLATGEGAYFRPGGSAHADLEKHQVWVCPMFEPFLTWLYQQDLTDLDALPSYVELPDAPFHLSGYRRPGPAGSLNSDEPS